MQIFMNLTLTDEERKDIKTCVEALKTHFKPRRNVVYEHYVCNMCSQNAEETVDEFVNCIRKLASSCQFGTLTEELIRDKLVLGISNQSTKLHLLKEEDLTLKKAVNICRSSEIANIQLKSMKVSSKEVEEVHAVQGKDTQKAKQNAPQPWQDNAVHYEGPPTGCKKPQQLETKVLPLWKTTRSQAQRLPGLRPNMQLVCKGKSLRLGLFIFKTKHT